MTSFQAKIVWKRQRKRENKIIVSFRPYLTQNLKFQKNSNNASMASFKARIGWKMPRKMENIYCRSASFLPNALQKIPKKRQKSSKKLKNNIMAPFQATIG